MFFHLKNPVPPSFSSHCLISFPLLIAKPFKNVFYMQCLKFSFSHLSWIRLQSGFSAPLLLDLKVLLSPPLDQDYLALSSSWNIFFTWLPGHHACLLCSLLLQLLHFSFLISLMSSLAKTLEYTESTLHCLHVVHATISSCLRYFSSFLTGLPASTVFSFLPFLSLNFFL